jgi:hypothetical protein
MLWTPISSVYFTFLSLETNALFGLMDHGARLLVDENGVQILYPDVFPPYKFKQDIRLPILQHISIHFNLIVAIGLFVATPGMPIPKKIEGLAASIALLSLSHTANIYLISYLFIWDYIDWKRWPAGIPAGHIERLIVAVEHRFPRVAQPYIMGFYNYSIHFLDEAAPLLVWLYFAYPYLIGKVDEHPEHPEGRQSRAARRRASHARS